MIYKKNLNEAIIIIKSQMEMSMYLKGNDWYSIWNPKRSKQRHWLNFNRTANTELSGTFRVNRVSGNSKFKVQAPPSERKGTDGTCLSNHLTATELFIFGKYTYQKVESAPWFHHHSPTAFLSTTRLHQGTPLPCNLDSYSCNSGTKNGINKKTNTSNITKRQTVFAKWQTH